MRVFGVLFLSLTLLGCAVSTKTEFTRKDLEVFQKTFTGTLVGKQIEEIDKEVPVAFFWNKNEEYVYFQITVTDSAGNTRGFFDYSKDKNRIEQLRQYYRDLQKGDTVVVGLGLVDEKNEEEIFDQIRKVI
jgi:hypothetical protein